MIIANTVGTPKWMMPALQTEYFIKTRLVLLGAEILFDKIVAIGTPGIFVAWVTTRTVQTNLATSSLLADLVSANEKAAGTELFNAKVPTMNAFAIITIVAAAVSLVLYALRHLVKLPLSGILTLAVSILTIVSAVILVSVVGSYCAELTAVEELPLVGKTGFETLMGPGAWLSVIGGFVAGGSVLLGTLCKK